MDIDKEVGPMSMSTKWERREEGTVIAKTEGRVDGSNASEFHSALESAISPDDHTVILDFEDLSYISSAGLRVILLVAKELRDRDSKLAVCSLPNSIREVFAISGFDKIIATHASQAEAIAALKG
jgi:anti-anti-sigma factor